jgi:hypothetical protein
VTVARRSEGVFDPERDVDPGNRAFYMRLGVILALGVCAAVTLMLALSS